MIGINSLVIMMLTVIFLALISTTSAVEIKLKKYMNFEPYLKQNGVCLFYEYLQADMGDNAYLLRDEWDIKKELPHVKDVLCVAKLWNTFVNNEQVTVLCYSDPLIKNMNPEMESGRFFKEKDFSSDVLKAVVTHNDGRIKTGDVIELVAEIPTRDGNKIYRERIEIIGVMADNESFYSPVKPREVKSDYRDLYYTYNYEYEEGHIMLFLADAQIYEGYFPDLNYNLADTGIQRQMTGATVITFGRDVPQEVIDNEMQKIIDNSFLYINNDLNLMNEKSLQYVLQELHDYLPVFVCVFIFVLIAAVSAGTIMVKKQLRNYAIYYLCGLPWKFCALISLGVSAIITGISLGMVVLSMVLVKDLGIAANTAMHLGEIQFLACGIMILCYLICAWAIPLRIVQKTSVKKIMNDYHL